MFEKFKKGESTQQDAGMMEQEKPGFTAEQVKIPEKPAVSDSDIGIGDLINKRTKLEKEIEDESVDIKNLKEKLVKVSEYIEEENRGIRDLSNKRSMVEREADEVGVLINNLRNRLANIDSVVESEANRVKTIKDSRPEA